MRLSVTATPRRIARLSRQAPVLLRVISGSVRLSDGQEALWQSEGIPLSAGDGIQNWIMPEGELWLCADGSPAVLEIIIP